MSSTFRATSEEKTGGGCHLSFGGVESLKDGHQAWEALVVKRAVGDARTRGMGRTSQTHRQVLLELVL